MKQLIFIFSSLFLWANTTSAVPALKQPIALTQPDVCLSTVKLYGDEFRPEILA